MKRSFYTVGSLVILLIAAFVFVLVPIFAGGKIAKSIPPFGKYDGKEIRYEQGSDLANYAAIYQDRYKSYGRELNEFAYYQIFNYAFNATVNNIHNQNAVKKSGYKVPQSAINRVMMNYFIDNETGKYSSKLYKLADKERVRQLHDYVEKDLFTQRYAEDVFGSNVAFGKEGVYGLKLSDAELKSYKDMNKTKNTYDYVNFDMTKYPEAEKIKYGEANSSKFQKLDLSVITVSEKSKAERLLKRINNKELTFEDAVKESDKNYSNDTGKLNSTYLYQVEDKIKNDADKTKVTSLKKDELSPVVETTIGYSFFKANEDAVESNFKDENVIKTVFNYLTTKEKSHIENYYTEQAKAFAESAKNNFAKATKDFNLKSSSFNLSPVNYGSVPLLNKIDTSLEGLDGADTNEELLKALVSLKKNEVSNPVMNGSSILVLRLNGTENVKAEEIAPDEAIKSEVSNMDSNAAEQALFASPKLENHFQEVYFKYMTNRN